MNLEHALVFEDAVVVGLTTTPTDSEDDGPREELVLQVGLTHEIADALGVKGLVYNDNGTVRSVWTRIALDLSYSDVRINTPAEHSGQSICLTPKALSGFAIKRSKAGAAKLDFKAKTEGYATALAEFVSAVGTAPFRLEVEPLQQQLPLDQGSDVEDEQPALSPVDELVAKLGYCPKVSKLGQIAEERPELAELIEWAKAEHAQKHGRTRLAEPEEEADDDIPLEVAR